MSTYEEIFACAISTFGYVRVYKRVCEPCMGIIYIYELSFSVQITI